MGHGSPAVNLTAGLQPSDHSFALCLTHDVDRPYKTYQAVYSMLREQRIAPLIDRFRGRNPYWQFDEIMELEASYGVRSAFYFLNEPHLIRKDPYTWFNPTDWIQHLGRYDISDPAIIDVIRDLEAKGWEVGLHGSYRSYRDVERLEHEKAVLEDLIDGRILGGRQHYLNLDIPDTWRNHVDIGLKYDASLGSGQSCGFHYGYDPLRPFGDKFVVFPLTIMEQALPNPASAFDEAWSVCKELLEDAATHGATMTVLWHPRVFSEREFPGYRRLYSQVIEWALAEGAWVGPPGEYYRLIESTEQEALDQLQ